MNSGVENDEGFCDFSAIKISSVARCLSSNHQKQIAKII